MSEELKTNGMSPTGTVSFPSVFEAKSFQGNEGKFEVTLLFKAGTDLGALKKAAKAAQDKKWPNGRPKGAFRSPFRDGNEKDNLTGYEDTTFVKFSSKNQPGLVGPDKTPIINASEFYPGCEGRVTFNAYAYDFNGNRGIAFGLNNVQKTGEGSPLSSMRPAEDDFDAIDSPASGTTDQFEDDWES